MRWPTRLVVIALMAALVVAFAGSAAGAATLADHGWWWRAQSGLLMELPPPPSVPEGGLSVARAPDGDVAWSAIRFRLDEGETGATLALDVANEFGGQVAAIDACLPNFQWRGGEAQRWDARPAARCDDGQVAGARSEDGATWTWDLTGLVGDGQVDVLLLPSPDAQAFQVDFEAPTDDALQTTLAPTGPEPVPPPAVPPAAQEPGEPPPGQPTTDPVPPPAAQAPQVPVQVPAPDPVPPQPEVAPDPGGGNQATTPGTGPDPAAAADPAMVPAEDLGRPVGLFLLVAALLTVLQLRSAPVPAVTGVGRHARGQAAPEVRGLGRFARSRTGSPPPLI